MMASEVDVPVYQRLTQQEKVFFDFMQAGKSWTFIRQAMNVNQKQARHLFDCIKVKIEENRA